MAFEYRARSAEQWEKRATQRGNEFEGYIKDEFAVYQPKKGENAIRILPPTWDDAQHYGLDIHVHFRIGPAKAAVLCLFHMRKEPCPICEDHIKATRADDDALAKALISKRRSLIWLIDRKEEEKAVQAWGMPWTADRDLTKVCKDRSSGGYYTIDHPEEGFDIYFDRDDSGDFAKYVGWQLARRPTSVAQEYLEYIDVHPLPDILLWRTYDEIKQLYEGGNPLTETGRSSSPDRRPQPMARPEPAQRQISNGHEQSERPPFDGGTARPSRVEIKPRTTIAPRPAPVQPDVIEHEPAPEALPPPARNPEPKPAAVTGAGRAAALRERFKTRG